eukprot:3303906-Prymnesium_polylepis.1
MHQDDSASKTVSTVYIRPAPVTLAVSQEVVFSANQLFGREISTFGQSSWGGAYPSPPADTHLVGSGSVVIDSAGEAGVVGVTQTHKEATCGVRRQPTTVWAERD